MGNLQFGNRIDGINYNQRPGVYAVIINGNGKCALIVADGKYHLPGGGIRNDEKMDDALRREVLEEIGFIFGKMHRVGSANQYCYSSVDKKYYNKLCHYFLIANFNDENSSGVTGEHDIHWASFDKAASILEHESHAWAVKEAKKMITSSSTR